MAPQNFTTTAQYKESDHTLVTDEDNDEGFAPNREIGDGLECRMETIARVARILRKKNATSTTHCCRQSMTTYDNRGLDQVHCWAWGAGRAWASGAGCNAVGPRRVIVSLRGVYMFSRTHGLAIVIAACEPTYNIKPHRHNLWKTSPTWRIM